MGSILSIFDYKRKCKPDNYCKINHDEDFVHERCHICDENITCLDEYYQKLNLGKENIDKICDICKFNI